MYIEVTEVNVVLSIPPKFFPCPPTSKSRLLALLDSLSTALSARMRDDLFDLLDPDGERPVGEPRRADTSLETLRSCGARLGQVARHLGLPLTAALAESAELVAEGELRSMQVPKGRQC